MSCLILKVGTIRTSNNAMHATFFPGAVCLTSRLIIPCTFVKYPHKRRHVEHFQRQRRAMPSTPARLERGVVPTPASAKPGIMLTSTPIPAVSHSGRFTGWPRKTEQWRCSQEKRGSYLLMSLDKLDKMFQLPSGVCCRVGSF